MHSGPGDPGPLLDARLALELVHRDRVALARVNADAALGAVIGASEIGDFLEIVAAARTLIHAGATCGALVGINDGNGHSGSFPRSLQRFAHDSSDSVAETSGPLPANPPRNVLRCPVAERVRAILEHSGRFEAGSQPLQVRPKEFADRC